MNDEKSTLDADVIVVGGGPGGLITAILLGRQGRRVKLIERHLSHYPLPRAVTFDDEVARILATIGIDAEHDPKVQTFKDWYELQNQHGQTLARFDWRGRTAAAWQRLYWFNQPELEETLAALLVDLPTVSILRGHAVEAFSQDHETVMIECRNEQTGEKLCLDARFMVGADGANSLVRTSLGLASKDLGFQFDWLIVDVKLSDPMHFDLPVFQCCDPARPTTVVPAGPGRRRWEFMVMPGETAEQLNQPEVAWQLLEKWGAHPGNCALERHVVWRFQGRRAEQWTKGRVAVLGDAAHLMPPFAGQGMCAAVRDAMNLSWKLGLLLDGSAGLDILEAYTSERRDHVNAFIDLSVEIGRIVCVTDPEAAAARDRTMIANFETNGPTPAVDPNLSLGQGIWIDGQPGCGKLSRQGIVGWNGQVGRFDQVAGQGWVALGRTSNPRDLLSQVDADFLDGLEVQYFQFDGSSAVEDRDGTYAKWFREAGTDTILIRPDFYVAINCTQDHFARSVGAIRSMIDISLSKPAFGISVAA